MKRQWLARLLGVADADGDAALEQARQETAQLQADAERLNAQLADALDRAQQAENSARAADEENGRLQADLDRQSAEAQRLATELERERHTDSQALKAMLAEVDRERRQRSGLGPVDASELPRPLQQMLAQLGDAVDATGLINDLWQRLMEAEARFNAAREDTNRSGGDVELLRSQVLEVYTGLVTQLTVLSAGADLLAMQPGLTARAAQSIQELKQTMAEVRQAMGRLQKIAQKSASGT